jgi:hypothetical protein
MKRLTRCWLLWTASLCVLGPFIQDCSSAGLINQQFTPPKVADTSSTIISNDATGTDKESPIPLVPVML